MTHCLSRSMISTLPVGSSFRRRFPFRYVLDCIGLLACPTPSLKAPITFIMLAIIPPVTLADSVYLKSARPFALEQSKHTTPKRRVLAFMGTSLTGRSDCEIAASRTRLDRQGPFDETQGQLSFLYLYLPRASSSLLYFSFRLFFMRAHTSSMARI